MELTLSDPETAFVHLLFTHSRPKNLSIRKIYCLHNPDLTKAFESESAVLEKRAKKPFFAPNLEEETDITLRKQAIQRWKSAADQFSPIYLDANPRNPQTLTKTYVLPLWHGTTEKICESIANDGFAISGSHAFKQGQTGDGIRTDIGFFGSGIYFTNSARYCSKAYAKGHMIVAWVSMRQPFPVVADHAPNLLKMNPKIRRY